LLFEVQIFWDVALCSSVKSYPIC